MLVLGLVSVPGWLVTIFAIAVGLYLYTAYKQSIFRRYGIPAPKPTPFLGSIPELAKKGMFQMDIDNVKKYGKYFGSFVGNIPTVMISDPDMIKEIAVKQFSNFQDRTQSVAIPKFWRQALDNATGGHWRLLRTTISPTFSSGKMRKMEPILDKCLDSFIEVLDERVKVNPVLDLQPVFGALTLDVVCSSAFGVEVNSQQNPDDPFVQNAKETFNFNLVSNPFFFLNFLFPESKSLIQHINVPDSKAVKYIKDVTQRVVDERKRSGSSKFNDLLQLLIDANHDSEQHDEDIEGVQYEGERKRRLTDDEILANAVTFLLAGYDTTATALTWLAYCLATNLDVEEKLITEIDSELGGKKPSYDAVFKLQYLDMVLSETLRLYSPVTRSNRQVVRDTVICGKKIPGGMSVTFPIAGMHRLPEFWPDPEKFDPERFSPGNKEKVNRFVYMPFGLGPRNCVGMRLALLEVKLAVVTLLQKYKVEPTQKLQVPPKIGKAFIVKPEAVWVRLVKRD